MRPTDHHIRRATEQCCEDIAAILAAGYLRISQSPSENNNPVVPSPNITNNSEGFSREGLDVFDETRLSVLGG
jgi:hypothetical protein